MGKRELLDKFAWCECLIWPCIETGYRRPIPSVRYCLATLFSAHNELVNCWTHLLGGLWVIGLLRESSRRLVARADLAVFCVYLLAAFAVCFFSVGYHLLNCHSETVCRQVQCLDWAVISLLIFASNSLSAYFELPSPWFAAFSVANGALMILTSWMTVASLGNGRKGIVVSYAFRATIYIIYGLGVIVAWLINFALNGAPNMASVEGILLMYCCYSSILLCLLHLPERITPAGSVDIVGSSHQIFHVGVIAGVSVLWRTYFQIALLD